MLPTSALRTTDAVERTDYAVLVAAAESLEVQPFMTSLDQIVTVSAKRLACVAVLLVLDKYDEVRRIIWNGTFLLGFSTIDLDPRYGAYAAVVLRLTLQMERLQ
jgi:hypothetical protein